jgi:diguanylate cyclase (GGDEF)-like protein/PAS domain S-box-containing protein
MAEIDRHGGEAELRAEIARLEKINRKLMDRAERSTDFIGSDFNLFQTAVMLDEQIRLRTAELEAALRANEAAERALRKSEAKFAALFSLTPNPVALTRLSDGVVLDVNRSFAAAFGYQPQELIGQSTLSGHLGLWSEPALRRQWQARIEADGEAIGFETPMRRKDGALVTMLVSGKVVDIDGETCVIVDCHDITRQTERAESLQQIAHHDPLTGLANRLLLRDRLAHVIAHNQRAELRVAVCYLDLDGFKQVNDRLGHQAGDQVLIEAAQRLLGCVRASDTVARLGGDEFVVLLSGLADDQECHAALERMLRMVAAPYTVCGGQEARVSVSIGVTLFPRDAGDPDTLVRHADAAMYAAKQAGKNRYRLFAADG